ncbi:MAG: phage tail tape measure protein [Pseudomonadota bacterium]
MTKNFDVQLKISAIEKDTTKTLDNLIAALKQLENVQKKGLGAKEAAASMRALKVEGQALRGETLAEKAAAESLKKANIELRNSMLKMKEATEKEKLALQKLKKEMADANEQTDKLGKVFRQVAGFVGFTILAKQLWELSKAAVAIDADFEKSMNSVKAVTNAAASEMQMLKKQAEDLGASTVFNARQSAEAMKELGKAGFTAAEISKSLPGVMALAAASGEGLAQSAEITAGALRGFGLAAEESTHVADLFAAAANQSSVDVKDLGESMQYVAPVAKASGQSIEEMTGILALLGDNMIKGSMAGTSMRQVMLRLQDPPREAASVLEQLGIKVTDLNGNIKPLSLIIEEFRQKTEHLTDASRNQAASMLVGMDASSAFLALVNTAPGKLNKYLKGMQDVDGAAKEMADTMNQGLTRSFDEASGAAETLAITLVGDMAPAIVNTTDLITDLIKQLTKWVETSDTVLGIAAKANQMSRQAQGKTFTTGIPFGAELGLEMLPELQLITQKYNVSMTKMLSDIAFKGPKNLDKETKALYDKITEQAKIATHLRLYGTVGINGLEPKETPKITYNSPLRSGEITSPYGPRDTGIKVASKFHPAVDMAAKEGTKVYSSAVGTIIEVGDDPNGYGKYVVVEHPDGRRSQYSHLLKTISGMGDKVDNSTVIALTGKTGIGSGPHLDFKVMEKDKKGKYNAVNPLDVVYDLYDRLPDGRISKDFMASTSKGKTAEDKAAQDYEKYVAQQRYLDLLANPTELGLKEKTIETNTYLEKLGLTDKDIEEIKDRAKELYEDLEKVESDFADYQAAQQTNIHQQWEDAIKKLAAVKVDYEEEVKKINTSAMNDAQKENALGTAAVDYNRQREEIVKKYYAEVEKAQKNLTDRQIDDLEKVTKATEEEAQKQIEIQKRAEQDTRAIQLATQQLKEKAIEQQKLLEAEASQDKLRMVHAEYDARANNVAHEKQLIQQEVKESIAALQEKADREAKTEAAKQALLEETQAIIENGKAREELLDKENHENEIERLKEVQKVYKELFEERLEGIGDLMSSFGSIFGSDNIITKIGQAFKSAASDIGNIVGAIQNLSSGGSFGFSDFVSTGTSVFGLAGKAVGWLSKLFNRKKINQKRSEGIKLGRLEAEYSRVLGGRAYNNSQFSEIVNDGVYLYDYDSTAKNLQRQVGQVQNDIAMINQQFNSDLYKQRGSEADQIKKNLVAQAEQQLADLYELQKLNEEKRREREIFLEEEKTRVAEEIAALRAANRGNPFEFNESAWRLKVYESVKKRNDAVINYADDPGLVAMANSLRQEEAKQLTSEKALGLLEAAKARQDFDFELEYEKLLATEASTEEVILATKEKDIQDIQYEMNRLREIYKNNADLLKQIAELESYKLENLESDYDDQLEAWREADKAEAETQDKETLYAKQTLQNLILEKRYQQLRSTDAEQADFINLEKEKALAELEQEMQELRDAWKDNEEILTQITELEAIKRININKDAVKALEELEELEAKENKTRQQALEDILFRLDTAKLKQADAKEDAFVTLYATRAEVELTREMDALRDLWQDNEELLTYITQLESLERVNISKDALKEIEDVQQAIRDELEATARESTEQIYDIDDLLTARKDALESNDYTRAKTRTEEILDKVAEIDKQIRLQFPDFLKSLETLTPENLGTLNPEELNDINSAISNISNFTSSNTYNNVFNIPTTNNASSDEIVTAIKKYLGDNNTRFVTT